MRTPAFETLIAAMMCLCPNRDNVTNELYTGLNSETLVIHKTELNYFKDKMNSLEKSLSALLEVQEKILLQLKMNPKTNISFTDNTKPAYADIKIPSIPESFQLPLSVDMDGLDGDPWLVIQQRYNGSVNFFRSWTDYERGFGILEGEFFIGLKKLHGITSSQMFELIILMEDFERDRRFARYDHFEIGSANESYYLKSLGKYVGNAGDSLSRHVSHKFSTYDRDNDIYEGNCAVEYTGAWWYDNCETSNLNGQYLSGFLKDKDKYGKGMAWSTFRGLDYSLKSVKIMIRPKSKICF